MDRARKWLKAVACLEMFFRVDQQEATGGMAVTRSRRRANENMVGGKRPRACDARESRLRNRRAGGCDLCVYVRSCPDHLDVLRNSTAEFLLARDVYQYCLTELVSTRVLKQSRRIFLTELLPAGSTC